jgi:hypothetical protein
LSRPGASFNSEGTTCYPCPPFSFEIAEKVVQSLDKFFVSGKPVPTLGEAQIAVFGFRVAGQFRQMLALGGSDCR